MAMENCLLLHGSYLSVDFIYEGKKQEIKALIERVAWNIIAGTKREDCFDIIAHLYRLAWDNDDKNLGIDLSILLDKLDNGKRLKKSVVFIDL